MKANTAERKEPERLALSVEEVLKALGLGRTKFYAEVAAGRLRVVRIGRRTLVRPQALEEWLSANEQRAAG